MRKWFLQSQAKSTDYRKYLGHGAGILLVLRDGVASDWQRLCRVLGIDDPNPVNLNWQAKLRFQLAALRSAGLIHYESEKPEVQFGVPPSIPVGTIRISEKWELIQNALEVHLAELADMAWNSVVVRPSLGLPQEPQKATDVFVLMPFIQDLQPVYQDHIVNVAKKLGISVSRADDFFKSGSIISDIWGAIFGARVIIADCTGRNPNVFYEIGLAHVVGKPVVLITQNSEDVPFDVRHLRFIQYEYTPRGMKDFEHTLADTLKAELGLDEDTQGSEIAILFLAADPTDASRLRLSQEVREIQEKIQLSKFRDRFVLHQRWAVRPADISQALLDTEPQVVHFSGHGTSAGALCVEDPLGNTQPIPPGALAALFEQFSNRVKCVILNACYSATQVEAIGKHIDYVIGMNQAISDEAAIAFTVGLYQALGAGRSIEEAFDLGNTQIGLQGIPEDLTPVLIKKH